jgi:hypothetical protein
VSTPWWSALGPAQTEVTCGDEQHLIRWSQGRLLTPAHPDAESELVLAALGGGAPPCVELLQTWGAHADDLAVLAVGPRSADDRIDVSAPGSDEQLGWPRPAFLRARDWSNPRGEALFRRTAQRRRLALTARAATPAHRGQAGSRPMMPAGTSALAYSSRVVGPGPGPDPALERTRARQAELRTLLALGTEFQWRLTGTVAAAWAQPQAGHDQAAAGPALTAALAGRLAPVVQAWLGLEPGQVTASLHHGPGWGSLGTTSDGLAAALPADWLARIWAPGLALVAGHLVVAVPEAAWPRATVLALARPGTEPAELAVHWTAGHWTQMSPAAKTERGSDQRGGQ